MIILAGVFVALLPTVQADADYPPRPPVHQPVHAQDPSQTPVLQVPPLPIKVVSLPPVPKPAKNPLARTGAQVIGEVTAALALIAVGVALLVLGRRRRRST